MNDALSFDSMIQANASHPLYGEEVAAALVLLRSSGSQWNLLTELDVIAFDSPTVAASSLFPMASAASGAGAASSVANPISAYQPLSLSTSLASPSLTLTFPSLVFYSSSDCIAVGQFQPTGAGGCSACPSGGFWSDREEAADDSDVEPSNVCSGCIYRVLLTRCLFLVLSLSSPGGGRVLPLAGYYSVSEYSAPIACPNPSACIGVDPSIFLEAGVSPPLLRASVQCAAAYAGALCSSCAPDYYQTSGSLQCFPCSSTAIQNVATSLTIIVGLGGLVLLAVGIAFLSPLHLASAVNVFLVLQSVALVGVNGSRDIPYYREEMSAMFTYLNVINVRPSVTSGEHRERHEVRGRDRCEHAVVCLCSCLLL